MAKTTKSAAVAVAVAAELFVIVVIVLNLACHTERERERERVTERGGLTHSWHTQQLHNSCANSKATQILLHTHTQGRTDMRVRVGVGGRQLSVSVCAWPT